MKAILLCVVLGLSLAAARDVNRRHKRQVTNKMSEALTGSSGMFESPGFPGQYPESTEKTYTINFPDPKKYYLVKLDILSMDIEDQPSCSWDYLLINLGGVSKLCGKPTNTHYEGTDLQGSVTFKFYSDYMVQAGGFKISYSVEELSDACTINPCYQGTCETNGRDYYTCDCPFGYSGNECQLYNKCLDQPCMNNGSCMYDSMNSFTCNCLAGFSGGLCEYELPCDKTPCLNGGTCIQTGSSYTCYCYSLYYYGDNCEYMVPQTTTPNATDPCDNHVCKNGNCRADNNGTSSYRCDCWMGYTGFYCDQFIGSTDNGTNTTTPDPCKYHGCKSGDCHAEGDTYHCDCWPDYSGFYCDSFIGSTDNGTNTTTSDPCDNHVCKNGNCYADDATSYHCDCWTDYTGFYCDQWIYSTDNGSNTNTTDPCKYHACKSGDCHAEGDTYHCDCWSSYSGFYCDSYNETYTTSGYNETYTTSGGFDRCAMSNPCMNGGECVSVGSDYYCKCNSGYGGDFCQYGSSSTGGDTGTYFDAGAVFNKLQFALQKTASSKEKMKHVQQTLDQVKNYVN